jgi:CBS domain-containing protein
MLVANILTDKGRNILAITPHATLLEAARVLNANRVGALLVLTPQGAFLGILSDRDIVRALAEKGAVALTLTAESCMTKDIAICQERDTVDELAETMTACRFRHMPVVENGVVVGIVSTGDVLKTRIAETMREAQALREYIAAT